MFIWQPNPGSQYLYVTCPCDEALFHGPRGNGKSDALLQAYAVLLNRGYHEALRGIIFRLTYKQLIDLVARSRKWFRRLEPRAKLNESDFRWRFPDGEELLFRYLKRPEDASEYQGHEYPFLGFEELTNWPTSEGYERMLATNRSSEGVPCITRSTCNPWGLGHNWVKSRFIDRSPPGVPFLSRIVDPETGRAVERSRVHLYGKLGENPHLDASQYRATLGEISNENLRKAWIEGSWDIIAGGFFSEVLDRDRHALPDFVPPAGWSWWPSFDWGSASPAAWGLFTISDGSPIKALDGSTFCVPPGSVILFSEWYIAHETRDGEYKGLHLSNEAMGAGMLERLQWWEHKIQRQADVGVADPSIFSEQGGPSIAAQLSAAANGRQLFRPADNSRIPGWQELINLLQGDAEGRPLFYATRGCQHFWRTVPVLPRSEKNLDDLDTESEDHIADMVRYAVMRRVPFVKQTKIIGF
jgi:hypothetical protein